MKIEKVEERVANLHGKTEYFIHKYDNPNHGLVKKSS